MNKGFTLVELLTVVVILGILVIIAYPAYLSISDNIKNSNYTTVKTMIVNSTLDYANKYLIDSIKPSHNTCSNNSCCKYYSIDYIKRNNIFQTTNNSIINPLTNQELTGYVKLSYDTNKYELVAEFIETEDINNDCEVSE